MKSNVILFILLFLCSCVELPKSKNPTDPKTPTSPTDTPSPEVQKPSYFIVISGDYQQGQVGKTSAQDLIVMILDDESRPYEGGTVKVGNQTSTPSDRYGISRLKLNMGTVAGFPLIIKASLYDENEIIHEQDLTMFIEAGEVKRTEIAHQEDDMTVQSGSPSNPIFFRGRDIYGNQVHYGVLEQKITFSTYDDPDCLIPSHVVFDDGVLFDIPDIDYPEHRLIGFIFLSYDVGTFYLKARIQGKTSGVCSEAITITP